MHLWRSLPDITPHKPGGVEGGVDSQSDIFRKRRKPLEW